MSTPRDETETTPDNPRPIHVVVAGAGPAGLLAAILLVRRNNTPTASATNSANHPKGGRRRRYRITLIDSYVDYGSLSLDQLKRHHRSWMIGLSHCGLASIKSVPNLYEDYVSKIGMEFTANTIYFGTKKIRVNREGGGGYVVDRNHVVAALARYLKEYCSRVGRMADEEEDTLTTLYNTRVQYVDGVQKKVLIRPRRRTNDGTSSPEVDKREQDGTPKEKKGKERYIHYDYLIGADGIRSTARDAILQNHRDFECSVTDIFCHFRAVHIDRPTNSVAVVDASSIHTLPGVLPNMNGIALPELGGDKLNVTIGYFLNKSCNAILHTNNKADIHIVEQYIRENFKAFPLLDYNDFAKQWINQSWSTTGQVHCNYYHSSKCNILLLGDAAHASSPTIGMGMNTALEDAAVLNRLLDEFHDDLDAVLPEYSKERVKEGRALTDLSYYAYSFSVFQTFWMQLRSVIRTELNKQLPWLIEDDPLDLVGRGGKLSEAYNLMNRQGTMQSGRALNDSTRREYFEDSADMVTYRKERKSRCWFVGSQGIMSCLATAAIGLYAYRRSK